VFLVLLFCGPCLFSRYNYYIGTQTWWIFLIRTLVVESSWVQSARCAAEWPVVPAPGDYDDGEFGGINIGRGNRSTRRKPAPTSLCLPQIPLDQTRARTWAAEVGSQRLTAWAMARLSSIFARDEIPFGISPIIKYLWLSLRELFLYSTPLWRIQVPLHAYQISWRFFRKSKVYKGHTDKQAARWSHKPKCIYPIFLILHK
jgi:hypothetical protein